MATVTRRTTKLHAPKIRGRLIPRERIILLLDFDPDQSLIMVCAPAGYGKSTAVAQWLNRKVEPSVWISADRDDAEVTAFLGLLVEGLQRIDPLLLESTDQLLNESHSGSDAVLRQMIAELSGVQENLIVVVDDYHLIESTELNRALVTLLENLPWQLQLVLIARTEPSLPIARLRASGEVLQLGLSELRFDSDETARFLTSRGLELTVEQQQRIHEATEGWAVALNLASLAIKRMSDSERIDDIAVWEGSSLPYLGQYLWQEVFDALSPDLRDFLIRISILDRFSIELCNVVAGTSNAAEMIARCEESNLFISRIDVHNIWYRFHHLFVDVLQEVLVQELSAEEVNQLHVRASTWLESHGFMLAAIQHAIDGQAWERAVGLLETVSKAEFEADRIVDLHQWLRIAPVELLERSPRLAFYISWAQLRLGYLRESAQTIAIAEAGYSSTNDAEGIGTVHLWKAVDALIHGRYSDATVSAREAIGLLSDDLLTERYLALMTIGMSLSYQGLAHQARQAFADLRLQLRHERRQWLRLMEAVHAGFTLLLEGSLSEASDVITRALNEGGSRVSSIWIQPAELYLGIIALEQRQFEESESHLHHTMHVALDSGASNWKTRIHLALARLERAKGNFETALEFVNEAIEGATAIQSSPILSEARALEAELRMARNQLSLANRWIESAEIEPGATPGYEREPEYLAYSRYLITTGDSASALPVLDTLRNAAAETGRRASLIRIGILETLALKELGDSASAISTLQETLSLGSELGFVQSFFVEWEGLAPLIRHIVAREHNRGYASQLLALADGGPKPVVAAQSGMIEEVSRREIEVLRLVAVGFSNREIGNQLFISEKTVKKHVSNTMAKLGTSNRTQTADLARQIGLI